MMNKYAQDNALRRLDRQQPNSYQKSARRPTQSQSKQGRKRVPIGNLFLRQPKEGMPANRHKGNRDGKCP